MRKAPHNVDALIKLLIQESGGEPFRQLGLGQVKEWLNVDLPRTQTRRVDLLGRTTGGQLLHIEFQGTNDASMSFRMAEYALAITRMFGEYPVQLVMYLGHEKLRMKAEYRTEGMICQYRLVDIRDLDGAALLASASIIDNILAVLVGLHDTVEGIRTVLRKIDELKSPHRQEAMEKLLLTCGVRGLEHLARKEIDTMPTGLGNIKIDVMKYWFLRPSIEKEVEKGRQKGIRTGRREGRQQGITEVMLLLLKKRFGRVPAAVTKHVASLSDAEAEKLALAILDAKSLKDLFGDLRK